MLQILKTSLSYLTVSLVLILGLVTVAIPAPTYAQDIRGSVTCGSGGTNNSGISLGSGCKKPDAADGRIEDLIRTIINVFSAIVGSVAVIMIIIGGFRYITSAGDSNSVSGAKNTILYAIVGLIIVVFAQIIVRFVLQRI